MPQARSSGSGSRSTAKSSSGSARSKRSTGTSSRSTRSSSRASRSTASGGSTTAKSAASTAEAQFEAVSDRLRKLNERIITAGKDAGETTLTSYEKALKAIAGAVEKGPGSSEVDWISHLANTQAKFIRDLTTAWAKAARDMLK